MNDFVTVDTVSVNLSMMIPRSVIQDTLLNKQNLSFAALRAQGVIYPGSRSARTYIGTNILEEPAAYNFRVQL